MFVLCQCFILIVFYFFCCVQCGGLPTSARQPVCWTYQGIAGRKGPKFFWSSWNAPCLIRLASVMFLALVLHVYLASICFKKLYCPQSCSSVCLHVPTCFQAFVSVCVCVHVPSASWKWNEAVVKSAAPGPARPKSYSVAFAPCSLCAARCLCLAFEMWWWLYDASRLAYKLDLAIRQRSWCRTATLLAAKSTT